MTDPVVQVIEAMERIAFEAGLVKGRDRFALRVAILDAITEQQRQARLNALDKVSWDD